MPVKNLKKASSLFLCAVLFFVFAACANNGASKSTASFSTNRKTMEWGSIEKCKINYGSYHNGDYFFEIEAENGEYFFTAEGMNGVMFYTDAKQPVPESEIEELLQLFKAANIDEWNGFTKSNDDILDGFGFNIFIEMDNGEVIKSGGYAELPDGFDEAFAPIDEYLNDMAYRHRAAEPQWGNIKYFSYSYSPARQTQTQYKILLDENGKYYNLYVGSSHKGRLNADVMQNLQQLLADEGISGWYGFNKANHENTSAEESFNLYIQYDNNLYLTASGRNIFPENFAEKNDILINYLEWLKELVVLEE